MFAAEFLATSVKVVVVHDTPTVVLTDSHTLTIILSLVIMLLPAKLFVLLLVLLDAWASIRDPLVRLLEMGTKIILGSVPLEIYLVAI